jgi:2-keto-4-pentenoate hydratase/2-oxohepta-3-ene-1,7-dioic acid hydratase in catechol pathway
VVELAVLGSALGRDLPPSLVELLECGPVALAELSDLAEDAVLDDDDLHALSDVELLAPLPRPGKILAVAQNYVDHIREGSSEPVPPKEGRMPLVFCKLPGTVIGPYASILKPAISHTLDWELELAAVIAGRARNVRRERGREVIAGYTIFNDLSARTLDYPERTVFGDTEAWFDFLTGKWCDTLSAMGPWLVTADEVANPDDLDLELRVNGRLYQRGNTSDMIYKLPELVAFVSRWVTLEPGDVIATGTPAGTGWAHGVFLQAGDVVEGWIEGLGTLVNPVEDRPLDEWLEHDPVADCVQ